MTTKTKTTPTKSPAVVPKKFRSKLPLRRTRNQISPILSTTTDNNSSSIVTQESSVQQLPKKKRAFISEEEDQIQNAAFHNNNNKQKERHEEMIDSKNDVSELSCVESSNKGNDNYELEVSSKCFSGEFESNNLVCEEELLSYDDVSSSYYSTSQEFDYFSDYSSYFDSSSSGSEFSQRSIGDNTCPSPTYSLFLQYAQQFSRSTTSLPKEEDQALTCYMRFEEEEEEESYVRLRSRERRQVYVRDYSEEYCSATECGDLVIQQRLEMVHWIVDQSATRELQKETLFLGVNLLDRFLSKGFFITKRNLQIVGIACLNLAIRIEENQPYNSVRQRTFHVGSSMYSRCEVVAMEWLVQEVLTFQCFLPTIYNFLWFYLKAAGANAEIEKTAKYLAVLTLLGHEQLCYRPSTVAAALVILACLAISQDATYLRVMETHVRTKDDDLHECIKSLQWLLKYAC